MASYLLERQVELAALEAAVERAARGHGSTALVLGEAGIGKTSLVQAFLESVGGGARVLSGACGSGDATGTGSGAGRRPIERGSAR